MDFVSRWLEKGFIDENLAKVLNDDIKEYKKQKNRMAFLITLYTIGAILLGISAILFIAANDWLLELLEKIDILKPLLILFVCFGLLFGGYYLSYVKKSFIGFSKSLLFLSSILIGADYIYITQYYHIDSSFSLTSFLWLISIFPMPFMFRMKSINWLLVLLFIIFSCTISAYFCKDILYQWLIYLPFVIGGFLYYFSNLKFIKEKYREFIPAYKLSSIAFIYIMLLVFSLSDDIDWESKKILMVLPILLMILNLISYFRDDKKDKFYKMETIYFSLLMLVLVIFSIFSFISLIPIVANLFIIMMLYLGFNIGYNKENVSAINLINFMTIVYILSIYCRFGWSYLDKTLFFFVGGVVLVSSGFYLEKSKRAIIKKGN